MNITFTSVGDCCIDQYVNQKKFFLGGGAFNTASEAAKLGNNVHIISSVGSDMYAQAYMEYCKKSGIKTEFLTKAKGSTSTIDIVIENEKPVFQNWQLGVLKNRTLSQKEKVFLSSQDISHAVLFSPMETLFSDFCSVSSRGLKIGDFSGESQYSKSIAAVKKYSMGLNVLVKSFESEDTRHLEVFKQVALQQDKICIALLGKNGSIVFTKDNTYSQKALRVEAVDTSGAGDIYIAHFATWYKKTRDCLLSMQKATKAASDIVSRLGVGLEIPFNYS